jgi:hypothetical protein
LFEVDRRLFGRLLVERVRPPEPAEAENECVTGERAGGLLELVDRLRGVALERNPIKGPFSKCGIVARPRTPLAPAIRILVTFHILSCVQCASALLPVVRNRRRLATPARQQVRRAQTTPTPRGKVPLIDANQPRRRPLRDPLAVHLRAASTHDRAAELHDAAADLYEQRAAAMRESGEELRASRAERLADRERQLAGNQRAGAELERQRADDVLDAGRTQAQPYEFRR